MHMICKGEGTPAVILQVGASAESLWWYRVQNQLAEHTQVCAFDRPGMGWSDPVEGSRDPLTIDAELHALIEQAGISAPYVMAGHSFGGILTRIYAAQYPEEVAGVVLVDTQIVTPKQFASPSDVQQNLAYWDGVYAVTSAIMRVGLMRLTGAAAFQSAGYPPELVPELNALQARNQVIDAYYAENGPAFPALQDASADAEDFGDLPVIILWASESPSLQDRFAADRDEIATYSSNSVTRTVEGADHGTILGRDEYAQQVSAAILDVIAAAQSGEPLPQ
jgi:pimeloyl-ACP methyl ester carboxylesterase